MKTVVYIVLLLLILFSIGIREVGHTNLSFIPDTREARILFAGDMMFDRTIRSKATVKGYDFLFSCIHNYVKGFDMVVANLEGSITLSPSLSMGTKPGEAYNTAFTFVPEIADILFKNNIRMVNVGNNHSLDFGYEGAESTRSYLRKAGISYFGSPNDSLVATTTIQGFKLAFVNFNQFLGFNTPEKTVGAIVAAKSSSDFVFVYTHWGDEYAVVNEYQKELARKFIDAGADMVIGSHPHVIQEHEVYGGKHIFYSLGNFVFDQYFNDAVKTGGGVEVFLSKEGIKVEEKMFDIGRDGRSCVK